MARLYEYQGKQLLEAVRVDVPKGDVACTPEEARRIAAEIGKPVAVKAQVWSTGRFKAGGIKFAETPLEAKRAASEIIGSTIKGFLVEKVVVEEKLDIDREYYAGVIVDDSSMVKAPVVIFSTKGGVEIEKTAKLSPQKVCSKTVDIRQGFQRYEACDLAVGLEVPSHQLESLCAAICGMYEVFRSYDARAVEINPLILTKEGRAYAADCRVSIDDASVVRHPQLGIAVPREADRPPAELDRIAWSVEQNEHRGVFFFAQIATEAGEEGCIGFHAIGGGGALLAADTLVRHGLKLAAYAETSGNPTAAKVYRCAKINLSMPRIEGYCVMGAVIASQDQWHHAHGLVKAFREDLAEKVGFPVVILLAGNKERESLEILRQGLKDVPIQLELYGREYIHKLDFVAARMASLVEEYRGSTRAANCDV